MGYPGIDALVFVKNILTGMDLKNKIKIINSGKVTTGFGIIKRLALGADLIYSARAMMLALGCIQALRCNTNHCPTGVATQDPGLAAGLIVSDKRLRVANYHSETIQSAKHMLEAMGIEHPSKLNPTHIFKRVGPYNVKNYEEIFSYLQEGELLQKSVPETYRAAFEESSPDSFGKPASSPLISRKVG
ncbi:MAG: glutamate synthase-related protein [Bacteriovoracaceae bacterium]